MSNTKILIVEDEIQLLEIMVENLTAMGHITKGLPGGENILKEVADFQPDLIVLDQMMPGKSGQEIIKELRAIPQYKHLPIIMVTAITDEDQIIKTLELGADDYLKKPASIRELDARIHSVIRRAHHESKREEKILNYKNLAIDLAAHRVTLQNQEVPLTLTEYKILAELLKNTGVVVSRDQLRENALGNLNISDRTIDVHMASLRKKLNEIGDAVETVRGVGYRVAV
jgi:DNA-binding response OmpR family regulator